MLSSVWDTDISHTVRLSSVWPINFQYHSQAAATGAFRGWSTVQTFKKAESSALLFLVVGR